MTYDLTPFITDADRMWLQARVTWIPRDGGDTVTVSGDYLEGADGAAELGCGIEEMCDDLGIIHHLNDTEHYLMLCDLVNRQLSRRPWAELHCPEGVARLELIPPP
ncbi:hypothetical protein MMAG44476_20029 [Mycolicibacterium mageritense DSM 44476 = CIP 104973]|uniref:hypothetical protein n=1 Tax=Mycobacteriaceae TaxID=1762 RepID=UPI0004314F9A|nr:MULTISPECIES: hypothetical protein [Mycobacteriaceae]MDO3357799.1 hypothetical protein [Mycobacteroides abscessus subsp. massiliense]WKE45630.1 hypothetical protein P3M63_07450 [Mycobacteroides abscessus subsp. massiliense]CDO24074.1 hypothetical protein BN978_04566 [Mycolicibacterium mageritense DSM 44476 = CIP 104973]